MPMPPGYTKVFEFAPTWCTILFLLFYIFFNFFYCSYWNHSSPIISENTSVFGLDFSHSFLRCPLFPILRW